MAVVRAAFSFVFCDLMISNFSGFFVLGFMSTALGICALRVLLNSLNLLSSTAGLHFSFRFGAMFCTFRLLSSFSFNSLISSFY